MIRFRCSTCKQAYNVSARVCGPANQLPILQDVSRCASKKPDSAPGRHDASFVAGTRTTANLGHAIGRHAGADSHGARTTRHDTSTSKCCT